MRRPEALPSVSTTDRRLERIDNTIINYVREHQNDEDLPNAMNLDGVVAIAMARGGNIPSSSITRAAANASIARLKARNAIRFVRDRAGLSYHHPQHKET